MQTLAYKPVHGEVRKPPARPPRRMNHARLAFGLAAAITFVLGFVLAPGWWAFTAFLSILSLMAGNFKKNYQPSEHERWLATAPESLDLRAQFRWGKL